VAEGGVGASPAARRRDWLVYWAYRAALPLVAVVPPRLAYPVLDRIGDLVRLLNRPARRAVEANLLRAIGQPGRRWRLAVRGAFRHGARNYYDTLRIPRLTAGEIAELVPVRGWEHLVAALGAGKGAILVGAHLSSIALAAQTIAARGYTIHIVVEPVRPPELLRLLIDLRTGVGLHLVPLGPRLGVELLAALRRNEVVGLIVDRDVAGTGIRVPFFGELTRLPSGPALLALRSGAAILPAIVVRRGTRLAGTIEPPIPIVRGDGAREDVRAITGAVTARLEYYIGRHPEQWTVFQPVWDRSAEC
jgi:KDO2-lipid IV(A) lauroyltransferase